MCTCLQWCAAEGVTQELLQPLGHVLILHHKEMSWMLLLTSLFLNKILVTTSSLLVERRNCGNSRGGLLTFANN